jgi:hypothetical protein
MKAILTFAHSKQRIIMIFADQSVQMVKGNERREKEATRLIPESLKTLLAG